MINNLGITNKKREERGERGKRGEKGEKKKKERKRKKSRRIDRRRVHTTPLETFVQARFRVINEVREDKSPIPTSVISTS